MQSRYNLNNYNNQISNNINQSNHNKQKSQTIQINQNVYSTKHQRNSSSYTQFLGLSLPSIKKQNKFISLGKNYDQDQESGLISTNQGKILKNYKQKNTFKARSLMKSQQQKVQQYFWHSKDDLEQLQNQDINRLTNKIKEYIIKLDNELQQKICNAIKQKSQNYINNQNNQQKLINLLKYHMMNNNYYLQQIQKQYDKLYDKSGQFKQEQYEILLQKQIENKIIEIKNQKKKILLLRKQIKLDENKRQDQLSIKNQKKLENIKNQILQNRRQEINNIKLIQKCEINLKEAQKLNNNAIQKLNRLIAEAQTKKINIQHSNLDLKYHQLKSKVEKLRLIKASEENTINRNITQIKNEIKYFQNEIKQSNKILKNNQQNSQKIANQSIKFLKKHKKKLLKYRSISSKLQMIIDDSDSIQQNSQISSISKQKQNKNEKSESKNKLKSIQQFQEIGTDAKDSQLKNQFLDQEYVLNSNMKGVKSNSRPQKNSRNSINKPIPQTAKTYHMLKRTKTQKSEKDSKNISIFYKKPIVSNEITKK